MNDAVRLLPIMVLLAGCAMPAPRPRTAAASPAAVDDGIPLRALPRQSLAAGECGIFLWKAGQGARLVMTARANPPVARIDLAGRIVDLPRTSAGGGDAQGLQAVTTYSDGSTRLAIELTIEQRPGLTQGAAIPAGSLRLDLAGGASYAMPVTGLLACQ